MPPEFSTRESPLLLSRGGWVAPYMGRFVECPLREVAARLATILLQCKVGLGTIGEADCRIGKTALLGHLCASSSELASMDQGVVQGLNNRTYVRFVGI